MWDVVIIDRVAVIAIYWRLHFITLVTFFSVSICDINEVALRFQVFIQLEICHNRGLLRTIFNSTALYLFLLQELFDYFINSLQLSRQYRFAARACLIMAEPFPTL